MLLGNRRQRGGQEFGLPGVSKKQDTTQIANEQDPGAIQIRQAERAFEATQVRSRPRPRVSIRQQFINRQQQRQEAADEKLSDIEEREGTKEDIKSKSRFTALIGDKAKEVTVPKALEATQKAARDPGVQKILRGIATVGTIATLPAQIAAPGLSEAVDIQTKGLAGKDRSVGDALSSGAKSLAIETILSSDERLGKVVKVIEVGKEIKEASDILTKTDDEPEESETEKITRILDANKNKKYNNKQLSAIQHHIDTTDYKPSTKLKKQLDTFNKDISIAKVIRSNPETIYTQKQLKNIKKFLDRNPGFTMSETLGRQFDAPKPVPTITQQSSRFVLGRHDTKAEPKLKIVSKPPVIKAKPKIKVKKITTNKLVPKFQKPIRPIKKEVKRHMSFKRFIENVDVDSVIHEVPKFSVKTTSISNKGKVEIDCSKLKDKKERKRCKHNRKLLKLKSKPIT